MKQPPSATVIQLGAIARSCLTPGQRGSVLAAFSKAIYLLTDTGELLWIVTEEAPMHRRCVQISSPLPGPLARSPFQVQDQHLMIDSTFAFDIEDACVWHAPRLDSRQVLGITELSTRVQTFYSNLDFLQAKGFGNLIPHILSLSQNESINPLLEFADSILAFANPIVTEIAYACLEHQPSRILNNMDALIGLGAGLTPSGDDFLGGLLFAIKNIQTVYPDSNFDCAISIEPYGSQTNLISFTLLRDLASGHAVAPLHTIIYGLLSNQNLEHIYSSVTQLIQVGHSTGWDMLTGLLVGLLITYRSNYSISSIQMNQYLQT